MAQDSMTVEPDDAVWRQARQACDSYTLTHEDARWVAAQVRANPAPSTHVLAERLHRDLAARGGYWPSAVEVHAIVKAVRATPNG